MGYIYKITNIVNGKVYIGQTSNKYISTRWSCHKLFAKKGKPHPLYNSMRKYGINNFVFEKIEECNSEDLNARESYFINKFNCKAPVGFNLTNGGESLKGKNNPMYGKIPWNKGIPRTKELKERLSKQMTGKEGLHGKDNPMYGKIPWNKGIKANEEYIKNCRLAQVTRKPVVMYLNCNLIRNFLSLGEATQWIKSNTHYDKADYSTIRKSIINNWNCYGFNFKFGGIPNGAR
jgi:group I intron endonuclease